jgi:hypothetical protein
MLPGTMSHGISRFMWSVLAIIGTLSGGLAVVLITLRSVCGRAGRLLIVTAPIGCSSGRRIAGRVSISGVSGGCLLLGCAEVFL